MQLVKVTSEYLEDVTPLFDQYRQFYNQPGDLEAATAFLSARIEKNESIIYLAKANTFKEGFYNEKDHL